MNIYQIGLISNLFFGDHQIWGIEVEILPTDDET